jgi:HSP20 family molecular chaperone IbpA
MLNIKIQKLLVAQMPGIKEEDLELRLELGGKFFTSV